jgi:hypothetical protein
MPSIFIRIAVSSAPQGAHANSRMVTDRTGVDLLPHRVRVYQCDGDALLSVIRGEHEVWKVRVNFDPIDRYDGTPIVLRARNVIEIDHGENRGSRHVDALWRGVWVYDLDEIGPVDSYACAVAGLRHLLDGNVNTDAIPFIERALAVLTRGGADEPEGETEP